MLLERATGLRRARGAGPREILLPVHVPLSQRAAAHGARPQLHHRRCDRPLPADAGQERVAADGLGRFRSARRKRRDGGGRGPGAMDLRQHRLHEKAAPVAGLRAGLGPRTRHLPAGVLPLESMVVLADAGARRRLFEDRRGELGPGGSNRAGQRTGDRRARLAHRRAGRKA